ncbi:OLC1v1036200C1 [Oldenlandia corymbosa var. corymbosa]|uniref:OLC1v1036200C1 n=1 Tax=Oldenlandia corymbosa var. corymbosa TaxID=529605 RepID=A0AAV1CUR3_OLDCO|nr:OLC1v1036200C1 [Oldenlandia corymbosa var. corymbosa]
MASDIGKPLKVDTPTLNMTRPSVARFCDEIDLTKELPKSVKVGKRGRKHEQKFTYEHIPAYCSKCLKIGHKIDDCNKGVMKKKVEVSKPSQSKVVKPSRAPPSRISVSQVEKPSQSRVLSHLSTSPVAQVASRAPADEDLPTSSGLSLKEKKAIVVDVQDNSSVETPDEALQQLQQILFVLLETIPEEENEAPAAEEDNVIEEIMADQPPQSQVNVLEEERQAFSRLGSDDRLALGNFPDDVKIGVKSDMLDDIDGGHGCWSESNVGCVWEDETLHGEVSQSRKQHRHTKAEMAELQKGMALWRSPRLLPLNLGEPWMIGGDFNVIRSLDEYSGHLVQDPQAMTDFNECIQECALLEIPAIVEEFTWGGTRHTGWVSKRLDRVLISQEWHDLFPRSSLEKLSRTTSDHCPMLHLFNFPIVTKLRVFRFQKMWLRRNDLLALVQEDWNLPMELSEGRLRQGLFKIQATDGRVLTNPAEIEQKASNFFHSLLNEGEADPRCNDIQSTFFDCIPHILGEEEHNVLLRPILLKGGRLVLIKHVLSSIPTHVFSAIPPPKAIIRDIEQRCQKFYWSGRSEEKRRHWRSWERIAFPYSENGLGVRSFQGIIDALTVKLWWKLKHQRGIWSRFIHSLSMSSKRKTSWLRVSKIEARAVVHTKVIIRRGNRSFWSDNWSPFGILWDVEGFQPPMPKLSILEFFQCKQEILPMLGNVLSNDILNFLEDYDQDFSDGDDFLVWKHTTQGNLTVKSAYESLRQRHEEEGCSRNVWNKYCRKKLQQDSKLKGAKKVEVNPATQKKTNIPVSERQNNMKTGDKHNKGSKHISIVGLVEVKLKEEKLLDIMKQWGTEYEYKGNSSSEERHRILLIWKKDEIQMSIIAKKEQFMHCMVEDKANKRQFTLTEVYGDNSRNERLFLWDDLREQSISTSTETKEIEADGNHRANTNGEKHVAANNGEDEQVEVVNANEGSKDTALKNNPYIRDPLSNIVGTMTRARRKRMDESLNSLIITTWAKEEIKFEDYKPKTINLLQVTPNELGPFGEKEFWPSIQGETTGHTPYGGRMDP